MVEKHKYEIGIYECDNNHKLVKWKYTGNKSLIPKCPVCGKEA